MTDLRPTFRVTTTSSGTHDVWLDFVGINGQSCSISVANLVERSGPIVRQTLFGWSARIIAQFEENKTSNEYVRDNGQFGVGA